MVRGRTATVTKCWKTLGAMGLHCWKQENFKTHVRMCRCPQEAAGHIVPHRRVTEITRQLHDKASRSHLDHHKTLEKAQEMFYWLNLKEDIKVEKLCCLGIWKRSLASEEGSNAEVQHRSTFWACSYLYGWIDPHEQGWEHIHPGCDGLLQLVKAFILPN